MKSQSKTFIVRQRIDSRDGRPLWQVAFDRCHDASYYARAYAVRWIEKYSRRGLTPVFENGCDDPRALSA